MTPTGLYAIAAFRIAIGLVLVLAAPASRAPRTLRVLGLIVIIAGLTTPGFGLARALAVVNWLARAGPLVMRLDAVVGMALGGFLVYVFRTPARLATYLNRPRERAAKAMKCTVSLLADFAMSIDLFPGIIILPQRVS